MRSKSRANARLEPEAQHLARETRERPDLVGVSFPLERGATTRKSPMLIFHPTDHRTAPKGRRDGVEEED